MSDQEKDPLWAAYASGVKKLDVEEKQKPAKKKDVKKSAAEEPETMPAQSLDNQSDDPMPGAWKALVGEIKEKSPVVSKKSQITLRKLELIEKEKERRKTTVAVEEPKPEPPPPALPPAPWKKEPLDLRVERNMSLGDVVIEAKLDLHGKTENEAHEALLAFIEKQFRQHRRLVLVITGRGRDEASVLRQNVPRWCEVPPLDEMIWAVRTAALHHGGEGAYYILLRKRAL